MEGKHMAKTENFISEKRNGFKAPVRIVERGSTILTQRMKITVEKGSGAYELRLYRSKRSTV